MTETSISNIAASLLHLEELKGMYADDQFGTTLEADALKALAASVESLTVACNAADFSQALQTIGTTQRWLEGVGEHTLSAARSEITHVVDAVWSELESRQFFHLSGDRANYFRRAKLFGESVYIAFPSARMDIWEAGNCLATQNNTAAVFHLMRAVEWGLRALCGHVGMRQARRPKKSGQKSYVPLAWSDWETLLNQLYPRVDARINKLKRGPQKQNEQEFYYPVLQDIRSIRDAWRNHVMHTRAVYAPPEADVVFVHVRRIMTTLAKRIKDESVRPVVKRVIIHIAQYGTGGLDYLDVTEVLRGYIASNVEVLASNHFFTDPYPNRNKHLLVKYSLPRSKAVKTVTFLEGQPVRFTK